VLALQARESEAITAEADAEAILWDLGVEFHLGSFGLIAGLLERFLGHLDRAEEVLRSSDEIYERSGERSLRSTLLALLAKVLVGQGRLADAERAALLAIGIGGSDDVGTLAPAHGLLAQVVSERDPDAAEDAARRALAEVTDMLRLQETNGRTSRRCSRPAAAALTRLRLSERPRPLRPQASHRASRSDPRPSSGTLR
jgi:hypothetical protein